MKASITTIAIVLCMVMATATMGAAVTFSNTTLTGVGDVDTNGALNGAFSTGGAGTYLIGGSVYVPGGNPLGSGFAGANPANAIGNANFDGLLNTASFGTTSLTLSGLNIGDSYRVQMFMTDNRACCGGRTVTVGDGGANSLATPAIGTPQSVIGNFTASATTQAITFTGSSTGYLNGYQVRNLSDASAPVTFTLGTITGAGDISTLGKLVDAQNTGGGPAITVGGVNFAPGGNPLGSGFAGANPGNLIGDANFDALLNTSSFGNTPITFTGLTPGDLYEFQGFFTDNRSTSSGRTVAFADGLNDAISSAAIGTPQFVIGTFIAADTDQTLFFGGSADIGYLNAFQLRNLTPEPTTIAVWLIMAAVAVGYSVVRRSRSKRE